jgi:Tfp pilus assembly protein PilP
MTSLRIGLVIAAIGVAAHAGAQAPAAAPAPPPAPAAKPDLPAPPPNFTYSPEGRRDPVLNLGRSGTQASVPLGTARPAGAAGLLVDELSVRGIVQSQGAYVAMVSGPAGQTFTVRAGSKLFDGTVRQITPQTVVILQQVTDPLSLQKQREVRKSLRVQEEGK